MSRSLAPVVLTLLLLGTLLSALADPAAAHRQGLRPGYERLLYDCSHDWGWESGFPTEKGHDLITLDIREATIEGAPMVLFEINMVRNAPHIFGGPFPMRERLVVETPRVTLDTTLDSTGEWAEGLRHVAGDAPAYLGPRKAGMTEGGGDDETLLAYDIGFRYDQLQARNGETVARYEVWSSYQDVEGWQNADYLAGGYHAAGAFVTGCRKASGNDPANDVSYFHSAGYQFRASTWAPQSQPAPAQGAAPKPPVADFTWTPELPDSLTKVTFTDASARGSGAITQWTWRVGDDVVSQERTFRHGFGTPGRYWVTLTAADSGGLSGSVTKEVVVRNLSPSVEILAPQVSTVAGTPSVFTARATDPDGRVVAWLWRFGDGHEAFTSAPRHTFDAPGTYTITVVVTDDHGAESTHERLITVAAAAGLTDEASGNGVLALLCTVVAAIALAARTRRQHGGLL